MIVTIVEPECRQCPMRARLWYHKALPCGMRLFRRFFAGESPYKATLNFLT
jgi:hypothetical protein